MVSSAMQRRRLFSRERAASVGIIARAWPMISAGSGGFLTADADGIWARLSRERGNGYSAALKARRALRLRLAITASVVMTSPKVR